MAASLLQCGLSHDGSVDATEIFLVPDRLLNAFWADFLSVLPSSVKAGFPEVRGQCGTAPCTRVCVHMHARHAGVGRIGDSFTDISYFRNLHVFPEGRPRETTADSVLFGSPRCCHSPCVCFPPVRHAAGSFQSLSGRGDCRTGPLAGSCAHGTSAPGTPTACSREGGKGGRRDKVARGAAEGQRFHLRVGNSVTSASSASDTGSLEAQNNCPEEGRAVGRRAPR